MDAKAPPVISVFMCDKEERLLEIVRLESEMTLKEALAKSIFLRGSCGYISINLVATVKKYAKFNVDINHGEIYKITMNNGAIKYACRYIPQKAVKHSKA
jgi:hypothetical protein